MKLSSFSFHCQTMSKLHYFNKINQTLKNQIIMAQVWGNFGRFLGVLVFQRPRFEIIKIKVVQMISNFERFQEIRKQANSDSYSSLTQVKTRNQPRCPKPIWSFDFTIENKIVNRLSLVFSCQNCKDIGFWKGWTSHQKKLSIIDVTKAHFR